MQELDSSQLNQEAGMNGQQFWDGVGIVSAVSLAALALPVDAPAVLAAVLIDGGLTAGTMNIYHSITGLW